MRFKLLAVFILFSLLSVVSSLTACAASDFDISNNDTYVILDSGKAKITQNITITNKTKYTYLSSYSINTTFTDILNLDAANSTTKLNTEEIRDKEGTTIIVHFPKRTIGIGKTNKFNVSFETGQVAKHTKSGWEISIPGLGNPSTFTNYSISITVPESFGKAEIITPLEKNKSGFTYAFSKDNFSKSGIYMLFRNDITTQEIIRTNFPQQAMFGLPLNGVVAIENTSDQPILNKDLSISSDLPPHNITYLVDKIDPYSTKFVPVNIANPPLLTMGNFKVKISFDGNEITREIKVGFLPDYYLILLGGLIIGGSIIVAYAAVKTWRIHFQK